MSKIVCRASKCLFNHHNNCHKNEIVVSGKGAYSSMGTFCESFYLRGFEAFNQEFGYIDISNTNIYCDAVKCLHNNTGFCLAQIVDILGKGAKKQKETSCDSYIDRI